ncbi:MAG: sugar transferase, partial [Sphingomonadales bacterium]
MIRLFKHYIPNAVLLLGALDIVLLFAAAEFGWLFRVNQLDLHPLPISTRLPQLISYAVFLHVAMISVGVYGADSLQSLRHAIARLIV